MKTYIFGNSGFANELLLLANDCDVKIDALVCLEKTGNLQIKEIEEKDFFHDEEFQAFVAVGSPTIRKKIVQNLKSKFLEKVKFPNIIHPTSKIMGLKNETLICEGSIICANCVVTSNVRIGSFSQINLNCSIGHDTYLGDYFTAAPGVNISGCCKIMDEVYFGTNSCTREKVRISSNVVIGCGAAVASDITEPGIYAGVPARRIKNG